MIFNYKDNKGAAMPLLLIFILVLSLYGAAQLQYSTAAARQVAIDKKKMQAYYIARSGAEATAAWMVNPDNYGEALIGTETSTATTLGEGEITKVKVYYKDQDNQVQVNGIIIESTGNVSGVEQTAVLTLTKGQSAGAAPDFDVALFADISISMDGSAWIQGAVGTNATSPGGVLCDWSTGINGNLAIGPGGVPSSVFTGHGEVTGAITNLSQPRTYLMPDFPSFPSNLASRGSFSAGWNPEPPYYINDDGYYTSISVLSELRVDTGGGDRVIRVGSLSVTNSGKIVLTGGGTLYLYVDDTCIVDNSGIINENGNPGSVFLYYKGSNELAFPGDAKFSGLIYAQNADLRIDNSGGVIGNIITGGSNVSILGGTSSTVRALYAPNARVFMDGSGSLRGAIVSRTFVLDGGGSITEPRVIYDATVKDIFPLTVGGSSATAFTKGRWQ